jgi:hypothetical protein
MRPWIAALLLPVVAIAPARADEGCRQHPDPVCMADWAVALASKGTTDAFRRDAIRVRLRLDQVAEAQRMLGNPAAHLGDPSAGEIAARMGNPFLAQRILREARARLEGMPATVVLFDGYRQLAEAHRRAGDPDQARATLLRALERIRMRGSDPRPRQRELAVIGLALAHLGDRDAAAAALKEAESGLLDEKALERGDAAFAAFAGALARLDAVAHLARELGEGDRLGQSLAALASRVAAADKDDPSGRAAWAMVALGRIAAALVHVGNRAAALRALALAQALEPGVPAALARAEALLPAYAALGAWDAAAKLAKAVPNEDARVVWIWTALAAEQGRQGALREAVASALNAPPELRAQAMAEAAIAATERR